jgi:hypothetical protein
MAKTVTSVKKSSHQRSRSVVDRKSGNAPKSDCSKVENRARKHFWARVNKEFQMLLRDPRAWKHELEERAAWGATMSDGPSDVGVKRQIHSSQSS